MDNVAVYHEPVLLMHKLKTVDKRVGLAVSWQLINMNMNYFLHVDILIILILFNSRIALIIKLGISSQQQNNANTL